MTTTLAAPVPSAPTGVRWPLSHAVSMLGALGVGWLTRSASLVGLAAASSLAVWVWAQRDKFERWHEFGAANSVTSLRALLLLALGVTLDRDAASSAALIALGILVLDGIDGWLARRAHRTSAFGANYDMETDACFVLMLALGLHLLGRAGAWVMIAGALRYVYLLGLWLVRRSHADAPRSRFGRLVFALVVVAFTSSLWPLARLTPWLPAAATLLLTYSFARGFAWSLRAGVGAQPAASIVR